VLVLLLLPHLLVLLALLILLPDDPTWQATVLMAAGVVALAFFASGGGVLLLRLLRVARPARPHVAAMVEQLAREMKVRGRVRVYELEWAQVNAVAWIMYRAVGFSRPLLEIMSADELRAIAAHEIAHLLEPPWVRTVRVLQMFAYLGAAPVIKYGGPTGSLAGWLLIIVLLVAYQRFRRRMEVRADQLESQTVADANTYMRSMIKLHEANMLPAVMAGAQSHPHLYDRLLAGGIQPDFPRPLAPSRTKPLLAALAATIATLVVMFVLVVFTMCCQRLIRALHSAPSAQPPPARAQLEGVLPEPS
jgi:Zn-dependent protease with chaperone function